jgi:hypothetical protein
MKHKISIQLFFLLFIFVKSNAQSINVSDILSSSDQYIEMEYNNDGRIKILNQAARERFFGKEYKILVDKKGVVDMPNLLSALNFMYNIGYEVALNYCSDIGSTNRYLLKKVVNFKKELLPYKL